MDSENGNKGILSLLLSSINTAFVVMLKIDISIPTHSYSSVSSLARRPSPQHYYSEKQYTNYILNDDVVCSYR